MTKITQFEELEIFKNARELSKEIYNITKGGEFQKDSRFVQQIHAAVGSIMDNIAEGGSCGEVRSQIVRASDVGFIDHVTAKKLYNDSIKLNKQIAGFIHSLKNSNISGQKYLKPET